MEPESRDGETTQHCQPLLCRAYRYSATGRVRARADCPGMNADEQPRCNPHSGRVPSAYSDRGGTGNRSDWVPFASYDRVETRLACVERSFNVVVAVAFDTLLKAAYECTPDWYSGVSAPIYATPIGGISTPSTALPGHL